MKHFLYGNQSINENGHLTVDGLDTIELAEKYGTPLYIYDVGLIRQKARDFQEAFKKLGISYQVAYASKAFSCIGLIQIVDEEGLSLDVVSGGELYTAIAAGFPPEKIHFHGNNKSDEELMMALEYEIGCIVVDNEYELSRLIQLLNESQKKMQILIRVTPGIEAHTHDYILTGQEDSKFGFDLQNGQAEKAVRQAIACEHIELLGIHCHIGSQIFETTGFVLAARKIMEKLRDWKDSFGFEAKVLNLGGGFGIRYTKDDDPIPPSSYIYEMMKEVMEQVKEQGLTQPEIWIEPGRSLVGDAGITLYKIGSQKIVPEVRKYLAVDGGMSDNIRPALYEAKYEAVLANRMNEEAEEVVSIAGKCCESGDMLIWDLPLPHAKVGDYLAVFCTGAYGYSMANNYNRIPRPPVVFVENKEDQLVIERETYKDLIKLDLPFSRKKVETLD
ncbi:diaminopimelate decarboxylase [Bacillus oleivorans]|uniref:Diaminopimelate decarboxylase n=1 Tax=Bacillus oleivorans TaxID=1448271 RepID=A0A285CM28_9BACI|nr:diaminopimelate decarboxylase [Bacillus oleivorans]SNX68086.1 diaminopimelate decarboxylase [Bacillus oleivorans]